MTEPSGRRSRIAAPRPGAGVATAARLALAGVWAWAGLGEDRRSRRRDACGAGLRDLPGSRWSSRSRGACRSWSSGSPLLLLIGLACRPAAWVSAVLFLAFIVMIGSAWARGLSIDCGCFGGGGAANGVDGAKYAQEMVRDLVFIGLAVFVATRSAAPPCPSTEG